MILRKAVFLCHRIWAWKIRYLDQKEYPLTPWLLWLKTIKMNSSVNFNSQHTCTEAFTIRKYYRGKYITGILVSKTYKLYKLCGRPKNVNFKKAHSGLPWWCSGWESTCQCRGHGFEPWSGKIPHATEQLGPWATTTEPAHLEPVLRNKRGRDSERPARHDEEWPPLAATRESPRTETKTQHSQK